MTTYIERWMTPWTEEVIVAAENALTTQTHPTEPEQLVVHTVHKKIAKVSRIQNDLVYVLIRTEACGVDIWAQEIWNINNARVVAR